MSEKCTDAEIGKPLMHEDTGRGKPLTRYEDVATCCWMVTMCVVIFTFSMLNIAMHWVRQ